MKTRKWFTDISLRVYGEIRKVYRVSFTLPDGITMGDSIQRVLRAAGAMYTIADYSRVESVTVTHFSDGRGRMVELPHYITVYSDGTTYGI